MQKWLDKEKELRGKGIADKQIEETMAFLRQKVSILSGMCRPHMIQASSGLKIDAPLEAMGSAVETAILARADFHCTQSLPLPI